jgi:hypothetical protein
MRAILATTGLGLLLGGCVVRTGLCESGDDCDPAQVCNTVTHRCEERAPDEADLRAPDDSDLAPYPDLTPVPPDLSGDLVGTGLLEVQRLGDGVGLVRSDPAGVACGVSCTAVFTTGSRVRLTVEGLDQDSFFAGWSGACTGEAACEVTVTGTVRVDATIKKRSFQPTASGVTSALRAVYGVPPPATDTVFAAGEAGKVLRWNGAGWMNLNNPRSFPLYGAWASDPTNLWVVGAGAPLRWNGTGWTAASGAFLQPFWGVFGTSATDIWAVGDDGTAVRWDGAIWGGEPTFDLMTELRALWGTSGSYMWLVGHDGKIQRWDGTSWKSVTSNTSANLYAVWGAGPSAVWAVGQSGTILRWNGAMWAADSSPTMESLRGVFGFRNGMGVATEVWAVGERGVALRWRAGRWTAVPSGSTATLYGVWGERPGELWAVGDMGTILRYDAHR